MDSLRVVDGFVEGLTKVIDEGGGRCGDILVFGFSVSHSTHYHRMGLIPALGLKEFDE